MAKRIENGEARPTHEEIAGRARAIYEKSGRLPGRDLDNWLQAEAELRGNHKNSATQRPERREPASAPSRSPAVSEGTRQTTSRSS